MAKLRRGKLITQSQEGIRAERLTFSSMTWELLDEKHGIQEAQRGTLFSSITPVEPSLILLGNMERGRHSRLVNERAKAYRLVDPVLAEIEALRRGQIASIPEPTIEVEGMEGLCGVPDFIISGTATSKILPIVAIVEAKKDDIDAGLPQCVAELYAAYLLNGETPERLYGCVTTGRDWQFVSLLGSAKIAKVDVDTYYIGDLPKLLGVLCQVIDTTLAALETPERSSNMGT